MLAELQDGFNLIGISANPYFIILGAAILVSMIANQYLSRLRRRARPDVDGRSGRTPTARRAAGRAHRQALRRA